MAGWKFLPRCGPTWAHSRRSIPRVDLSRCKMRADRRGDGAVERAGLENRNTRKRIVGSNPTLSAKTRPGKSPRTCRRNRFSSLAAFKRTIKALNMVKKRFLQGKIVSLRARYKPRLARG